MRIMVLGARNEFFLCFSRRHGGHGGGGSGAGGLSLGAWDGVEGGVSHGGTEGTEVMAPNVEGLSQGGLGRFGEGCFSRRWGKHIEIIPVMCKGSIE